MQWLIDIIQEKIQASFQNIIVAWSGAIIAIPSGWVLCDGNNNTPDLQNRFIVGAGDTFAPDDTGGGNLHEHEFTSNPHTHNIPFGVDISGGTEFASTTDEVEIEGVTEGELVLPPYYALAYIMKT